MKYRSFGNTGWQVSEIGFGAWAIGGAVSVGDTPIGWGKADDALSVAALKAALDAGINFFDTADFYGLGHSEDLLGEVIGNRSDVFVATKVGQRKGADNQITIDYSYDYLVAACDQSLKRLRRDAVDYYQLHVARLPHLEAGECVAAMQDLQKAGKIRYWGISLNTFQPSAEANWLMERGLGSGFQLVLNLMNQLAVPLLERAGAAGYGIIARMPLQFGLLSGKFRPTDTFAADDHRSRRLTPPIIEQTLDILRSEMVLLARQYNVNLASLALAFVLSFPEVSTIIPGIRTPRQVDLNTVPLPTLSASDHAYLKGLFETKWMPVLDLVRQQG